MKREREVVRDACADLEVKSTIHNSASYTHKRKKEDRCVLVGERERERERERGRERKQ